MVGVVANGQHPQCPEGVSGNTWKARWDTFKQAMGTGERPYHFVAYPANTMRGWQGRLSATQWAIVTYIMAKSYGNLEIEAVIPSIWFAEGEPGVDYGAGVSRRQFFRDLTWLKAHGLVTEETRDSPEVGHAPSLYRINHRASPPPRGRARESQPLVPESHNPLCQAGTRESTTLVPESHNPLCQPGTSKTLTYSKELYSRLSNNSSSSHDTPAPPREAGRKGGEAASPAPAAPADSATTSTSCPTGLPLRGVAAGGNPRTPLYKEPPAGAPPQTPETEGAAVAAVDESVLTPSDHAELARVATWASPSELARLKGMMIRGRQETIEAALLGGAPPRPPERQKPAQSRTFAREPGTVHENAHQAAQDQNPAPSHVNLALQGQSVPGMYKAFRGIANQSAMVGELTEMGIEKKQAQSIVTRYGSEVSGWIEKAATKNDPAAYLMSLVKIAEKKRR